MNKFIDDLFSQQITITDTIQAFASLVSLIIAFSALRISRIAAQAPFRSEIRLTGISTVNGDAIALVLQNSGPGAAYNIALKTHIAEIQNKKIRVMEEKTDKSVIAFDLQPNTTGEWKLSKPSLISTPFIIEWELATGKIKKKVWQYNIDSYGNSTYRQIGYWKYLIKFRIQKKLLIDQD